MVNVASVARSFFRGAGEGGCIVSENRVGSGSLVPRPGEEETPEAKGQSEICFHKCFHRAVCGRTVMWGM